MQLNRHIKLLSTQCWTPNWSSSNTKTKKFVSSCSCVWTQGKVGENSAEGEEWPHRNKARFVHKQTCLRGNLVFISCVVSQHPAPQAMPWPGTSREREKEVGLAMAGGDTLKQSWGNTTGLGWPEQPRTGVWWQGVADGLCSTRSDTQSSSSSCSNLCSAVWDRSSDSYM